MRSLYFFGPNNATWRFVATLLAQRKMCNSGNFRAEMTFFRWFCPPGGLIWVIWEWLGGEFGASRGLVGAPGGLKSLFHPPGRDFGGILENRLFDPPDPYMAPTTGPVPPY